MTVTLSKRSVLNVNFAGTPEYAFVRMNKVIITYPDSDDFPGPFVIRWTGGPYFLLSNYSSWITDNANSTSYTGNGTDRWIATDARIEISRTAGADILEGDNLHFTGSAPTDFVIYRKADEADYLAGKMFRRAHLQDLVDLYPGAMRCMNWFGGTVNPLMRWEHRSLPTDNDYGEGFNTVANAAVYGTTSGTNQYTLAAIGSTPASMQHGEMVECTIGTGMVRSGVKTVTSISKAANGRATCTAHGYNTGDIVIHDITAGMTQLNDVPCTITKIDANTYDTNVNTSGFGVFTVGTVNQYITLQAGSGGDRVAYPVVFNDGATIASYHGDAYIATNDKKAFYFDKTMVRSTAVTGAWMFNNLGSNVHSPGVPPAVCVQFLNELNALATAQGKGPIHIWINIPVWSLMLGDPNYDADQSVVLKFIDLCLNGGDGVAALPSGVKILVECCNELWNSAGGFSATYYCARRSFLRWGTSNDFSAFAAFRACQMAYTVRQAYPTQTASGRVVLVNAGWGSQGLFTNGPNDIRIRTGVTLGADAEFLSFGVTDPMDLFDIFVTASYFYDSDGSTLAGYAAAYAAGNAAAKDAAIAGYLVQVEGSPSKGESVSYYRDTRLPEYATAMALRGKLYGGYEGGPDWAVTGLGAEINAFLLAVKSSQRWADEYRTYFDAFLNYGSAALPADYIMVGDRWGHCTPDTYGGTGIEGGGLDLAWDEITDYNNPESAEQAASTSGASYVSPEELAAIRRYWEELEESQKLSRRKRDEIQDKLSRTIEAAYDKAMGIEPEAAKAIAAAVPKAALLPAPELVKSRKIAAPTIDWGRVAKDLDAVDRILQVLGKQIDRLDENAKLSAAARVKLDRLRQDEEDIELLMLAL